MFSTGGNPGSCPSHPLLEGSLTHFSTVIWFHPQTTAGATVGTRPEVQCWSHCWYEMFQVRDTVGFYWIHQGSLLSWLRQGLTFHQHKVEMTPSWGTGSWSVWRTRTAWNLAPQSVPELWSTTMIYFMRWALFFRVFTVESSIYFQGSVNQRWAWGMGSNFPPPEMNLNK